MRRAHRQINSPTIIPLPNAHPLFKEASADTALVNKRALKRALSLQSTRIIDDWVRKRMISFHRLGHRTLLFSVEQVREDLARFEVKAIGRTKK